MTVAVEPPALPDVSTSTVVIWVTIGAAAVVIAVTTLTKVSGPIRSAVDQWMKAKRRAAVTRDDADIRQLKRQVQNLDAQLQAMEARERQAQSDADAHRVALSLHAAWDWRAIEAWNAAKAGQVSDLMLPAPPLYPKRPVAGTS